MFWAIILCYFSYFIYYDYNEFFKEKEVYYQQKPIDVKNMSKGLEWFLCNNADYICYGNGNYDFKDS